MALVVLATKGFHLFFISFWSCGRSCCCCCHFYFDDIGIGLCHGFNCCCCCCCYYCCWCEQSQKYTYLMSLLLLSASLLFFLLLQLVVVCCCQNWTIQFMFCFLYDCIRHSISIRCDSIAFNSNSNWCRFHVHVRCLNEHESHVVFVVLLFCFKGIIKRIIARIGRSQRRAEQIVAVTSAFNCVQMRVSMYKPKGDTSRYDILQ